MHNKTLKCIEVFYVNARVTLSPILFTISYRPNTVWLRCQYNSHVCEMYYVYYIYISYSHI